MATGIRTKTLVLLTTAAILGGGLYFFEQQLPPSNSSDTKTRQPLFSFQEADVVALNIIAPDYSLNLKKLDTGNWVIHRQK
ncbi:MAG: hypothetical protein N2383_16165, partial [Caldilineales bacterium]|nr:hypothetical protein [Caldilineales bacterium]